MNLCRTTLWLTLSALPLACAARVEAPRSAQTAASAEKPRPEHIPVRHIRWFESGLAQVERQGQPTRGVVKFHVPRPHLDDILRTLVIHGEKARVPQFSVDFESVVVPAVAQAQANLPAESTAGHAYLDMLLSLKGERVEVGEGEHAERGRLVDVAPWTPPETTDSGKPKKAAKGKAAAARTNTKVNADSKNQYELTLLTDAGALVRIKTENSLRLRPLDDRLLARLAKALLSRSASAERYSPELRIKTDRDETVTVSYVSEVPLPQLNYRLNLGSDTTKLTGAVLLHNDSDEPWESVAVEICNDEPDTTIVPLAAPRYGERPMETPGSGLGSLLPQLHASSADMLTTNRTSYPTSLGSSSPSRSSQVRGRLPASSVWNPKTIASHATARESYQYNVSVPVSLDAHASALVPFLDATPKAERGVWIRSAQSVGRSIVRLENTTAREIPAGLVTVFESGRYAGTTQLSALAPQQKQFVDFGAETELKVKWDKKSTTSESSVRSVVWDDGTLTVSMKQHDAFTVDLSNTGNQDLSAYVALSVSDDAKVGGADRIEMLTLNRPAAAVIVVPAHKQVTRTITIDQTKDDAFDLDDGNLDELKAMVESTNLPAASRAVLKAVYGELTAVRNLQPSVDRNEQEVARIESAIERLPSSSPSQLVAARLLQLENQRLALQEKNVQLARLKEQKMTAIKSKLSQLPKPAAK